MLAIELCQVAIYQPQHPGTVLDMQEYFLMALSQPRSQANRASKHMRVASVTPANRAASVTAGMEPRNLDVLRRAHEKELAEKGEKPQKAPPPKGVLRTIKPIASSVASVGPRMVKFRSNIQYLGEKVRNIPQLAALSALLLMVLFCRCRWLIHSIYLRLKRELWAGRQTCMMLHA